MENSYCVYVHTNKSNGKRYVGITSREPEVRMSDSGISACCRGNFKGLNGFVWKYTDDIANVTGGVQYGA